MLYQVHCNVSIFDCSKVGSFNSFSLTFFNLMSFLTTTQALFSRSPRINNSSDEVNQDVIIYNVQDR